MVFPRYKDFGKASNTLLVKEGLDVKNAAKVEAKSGDAKFTAEWTQEDTVKGSIKAEFSQKLFDDASVNLVASAGTGGDRSVEATVKGLATGVEVTGSYKEGKATSLNVGARYRKEDLVDAEFSVDVLGKSHVLDVAASTGYENFFFGVGGKVVLTPQDVEAKVETDGKTETKIQREDTLADYTVSAGYAGKDFEVAVKGEKKLRVISGAFSQKLDAAFEVGAGLSYNLDAKSDAYKFSVAGAYRADGTTTKVRADTEGDLVGSFQAPVKGSAVVTVVGKVNVLASDKMAVGLQVALK